MNFIQRSIELKWPLLLFEVIFLIAGVVLIVSGIKIRKKSTIVTIISITIGILTALLFSYSLLWTLIFGYNS
ncbi:hypothetical protein SAMN04488700_0601 [Carnobacterium iners]|uniref:Uncharacterized protein n=1 Tax=Carnobacterium iners TaxID=1073423 RepID=A0A1X7MR30_9LACT|nr:hypothetical protein SAMN04488114_13027 [Carnobacterium iners]SMH27299.1 hypothetical protein SAMN04488700_0601 [Carnobacterium iners]